MLGTLRQYACRGLLRARRLSVGGSLPHLHALCKSGLGEDRPESVERLQKGALDAALEVIDGLREQVGGYEEQLAEHDERDIEEIGKLEGLLGERDEELADLREELREAEDAQYDRL